MDDIAKIKEANDKHNLDLLEEDVHVFDDEVYISSKKAAQLLHTTVHTFSRFYVTALVRNAGVRRMRLGKRKFYCLEDMEKILREVVKTGKSVFEVCKLPVDPKDQRPIRHDTVHLHSNESQPTPAEKIRAEGIKCPSCGTVEEYVSKTNIRRDNSMYRTKECKRCGERFATLEVPLGVIHVKRRNRKKKQKEQRIITG